MLISFSLSDEALDQCKNTLLEERISNLLRSHKAGYNFVVVNRDTGAWCLNRLTLIDSDKSILNRLVQEVTQTGELPRKAQHMIALSAPGTQLVASTNGSFKFLSITVSSTI